MSSERTYLVGVAGVPLSTGILVGSGYRTGCSGTLTGDVDTNRYVPSHRKNQGNVG